MPAARARRARDPAVGDELEACRPGRDRRLAVLSIPSHPAGAQATDARLRVGDPVATAVCDGSRHGCHGRASGASGLCQPGHRRVPRDGPVTDTVRARHGRGRFDRAGWRRRCQPRRSRCGPTIRRSWSRSAISRPWSSIRPTSIRSKGRRCQPRLTPPSRSCASRSTKPASSAILPGWPRAAALVLAVTAAYVSSLWLVIGIDRRMATRLAGSAERRLRRLPGGEALLRVADARTTVQRCLHHRLRRRRLRAHLCLAGHRPAPHSLHETLG